MRTTTYNYSVAADNFNILMLSQFLIATAELIRYAPSIMDEDSGLKTMTNPMISVDLNDKILIEEARCIIFKRFKNEARLDGYRSIKRFKNNRVMGQKC